MAPALGPRHTPMPPARRDWMAKVIGPAVRQQRVAEAVAWHGQMRWPASRPCGGVVPASAIHRPDLGPGRQRSAARSSRRISPPHRRCQTAAVQVRTMAFASSIAHSSATCNGGDDSRGQGRDQRRARAAGPAPPSRASRVGAVRCRGGSRPPGRVLSTLMLARRTTMEISAGIPAMRARTAPGQGCRRKRHTPARRAAWSSAAPRGRAGSLEAAGFCSGSGFNSTDDAA